jgi:hypothetical protein
LELANLKELPLETPQSDKGSETAKWPGSAECLQGQASPAETIEEKESETGIDKSPKRD